MDEYYIWVLIQKMPNEQITEIYAQQSLLKH